MENSEDNVSNIKVDVRIIITGHNISEFISKAINNMDLEKEFNIIVSSIIPTTNLKICNKVASGADIILIGGYGYDEEFNLLFNELKTDFNHIGLLNYNNIFLDDDYNINLIENEIINSIIKTGLSYTFNGVNIHKLEDKYNNLLKDYNNILKEKNTLSIDNSSLQDEINLLNLTLDEIKLDFSSFKDRFSDIYSKKILEIFNIKDLWKDTFNEELIYEDKIVIATNKFKPEDIIIGQGFIGAKSKELAIEWLKIIKTALIFVEDNNEDLKKELNNTNKESISKEVGEYEIPNNFESFWD